MIARFGRKLYGFLVWFAGRVCYRIRQFHSVIAPEFDEPLFEAVLTNIPQKWRCLVRRLRMSEKAHILRLYRAISGDENLADDCRTELIELCIVHDIGKIVTRPSLFYRIMKVLLPLPNRAHGIAGARILKKLGAREKLIRRVRTHHDTDHGDTLLKLFQEFDDRN